MPGDEGRGFGLLDEEIGVPAQQVVAEHILDRIEDFGVADKVGEKREQEVRLVADVAAQRPAHPGLNGFEVGAQGARVSLAHHRDRGEITVALVGGDLGFS